MTAIAEAERKEWIGDKVTTRWLPPEEYFRVEFLFLAHESRLPNPELSRIQIAEDANGDIVGMAVFQLLAHCEPIWVSEDSRRQGVVKLMVDEINSLGLPYYSLATNDRVASIWKANGMEEKPWRVFLHELPANAG